MPSVKLKAAITTNTNAIVIDGQDGGHFRLDVDDKCIAGLAALALARNTILDVTIEWKAGKADNVTADDKEGDSND